MIVVKYELSDEVIAALCETYQHSEDDGLTDEEFAEHQIKSYIREVYEAWAPKVAVKVVEEAAREQAKTDAILAVKVLDEAGEVKPEKDKSVKLDEVIIDEVIKGK